MMTIHDLDLPWDARFHPFRPPVVPRAVACLHCGRVYSSDLMRWNERSGQWECMHPTCEGMGYGVDIHEDWIGTGEE